MAQHVRRESLTSISEQRQIYQIGQYIVAAAFLFDGLVGLTLSSTAKQEFHRCQFVMLERFFGGDRLNPSDQNLADNFYYFSAIFLIHRLLMIAFGYLVVQQQYCETSGLLGAGLVIWDVVFFTNPLQQPTAPGSFLITKLLFKQMVILSICLFLIAEKDTSQKTYRSNCISSNLARNNDCK